MRTARQSPCFRAVGLAVAFGLAGAGMAGCSSAAAAGTTGAGPAGGTAAATGKAGTSAAVGGSGALSARLLAVSDLPSGWAIDAAASNPSLSTPCSLLNSAVWSAKLPAKAGRDLNGGMAGPYLDEQFGEGTAADAEKAWQALVAGLSKCTTYTHDGSSGKSTFSVAKASSFPVYGDGSYAFTLTIDITGGVSASGDIVAARAGNSIVVLYIAGLTGVDSALVDQAVTKAVARART